MKILTLLTGMMLSFNIAAQPIIEFVVSATPGGPNDTITRKLVEKIEKGTNLKFVILNKPGAAHTIAYNYTLHTDKQLLILSTPEITTHEVYSKVDEIYNTGYFTNTLFVSAKSDIKNFKQLVEVSKTREIVFGHGGVGTYSYAAMQVLCEKTLKCLNVAYKGGSEGMLAVMSGSIDAYAITSYGSRQFLENDKLIPIYEIRTGKDKSWFKLFGKNILARDKELIVAVLKSQEFKFYSDMGFEK